MKAVRFHGQKDIRVEEVNGPMAPLAADDVLIKPLVCGICGTDLHEYVSGAIVTPTTPHVYTGATNPQILGHEFSALVLDVGKEIKHVHAGDRISVQPLISPRNDYFGRRGLFHLSPCMACVGLSWAWGGLGQRAVVKGYNAVKISSRVSDIQGALIEPAAVAVYALDRGRVTIGSTVMVSGMGPIGALCLLGAKAAGASKIFVSEVNPNRLARARELVHDCITVNPRTTNLEEFVRDQTEEGVGVDAAIECGGAESSLNACIDVVRRQGVVVQAGLHSRPALVDPMKWALKDITIEATWCYPTSSWPRIASMIEGGNFPVEKVVTAKIAMDDVVAKGFDALLDPTGNEMKVLVALD